MSPKEIVARNRRSWNKMPAQDMHADTNLIRCRKKFLGESKNKRLLDIGFGEGANLLYFATEGFDCFGTEIAGNRLKLTQNKFKKAGRKAALKLVDSNDLPFADNFFDAVVAWQSIFYNDKKGYQKIVAEIFRTLKPGGHFLCSTVSDKHAICAKKIAANLYSPKIDSQRACLVCAFKNKERVKEMFKKFSDLKIGFSKLLLFKEFEFYYIIHGRKPL